MAGTPLIYFRSGDPIDLGDGAGPVPLHTLIDAEVARLRPISYDGSLDRSAWIRRAVIRDLQHNRRARRSRRRKTPAEPPASDAPGKSEAA